ncbi:MAG: cupredoxin family copper-binding protein [Gammaproteobacteria bacterium]
MNRYFSNGRSAAMVISLAAALTVPGIIHAGPGCMNDQRMTRGYVPYSPMMPPQAGYRQAPPYGRYAMPPMQNRWMAAPYQGRMTAQPGNRAVYGKPATAAPPVMNTEKPAMAAASSDSKPAAETITVRISGMRFEPANLTVKPGTTVNWVQADRMPHTVSGNGNGLRSNTLQSGQTYSYTFKEAGNYDYVCDFHPSMRGVVVVEESGTGV